MYYKSRADAGRILADKLGRYRSQHIVVVSLGLGSSIVAAQIAMRLHANMALYVVKDINIPGETNALAGMGSGDIFTFNDYYSSGQLEEMQSEYHGMIEQQRLQRSHEMHALLGHGGEIDKNLLRHRTIILTSDGMSNAFALSVASDFLKSVAIKRLIIATPIATIQAVDRMHLIGDEICCLSVAENFFGVDHYYEDNIRPDIPGVIKIMRNISINWDRTNVRANVYIKPSRPYKY